MKLAIFTTQALLAIIAVLLGMIWHKMPGKENLPALNGEEIVARKGSPENRKSVRERTLVMPIVSVDGTVEVDNTVQVDFESISALDVNIVNTNSVPVEIKNHTPLEVEVTDDVLNVDINNQPVKIWFDR